jgi:hypothetical protein
MGRNPPGGACLGMTQPADWLTIIVTVPHSLSGRKGRNNSFTHVSPRS